jgi:SAM-dependent methyltransferase
MSILNSIKTLIPKPIKKVLRPIKYLFTNKYESELSWWRYSLKKDNGRFSNSHYERLMLAMAEEKNDEFLQGKIVADFGCGPRGSLVWAKSAFLRIGIDVLVDQYADEFTENIISHGMIYLKSTEHVIPLPSEYVDVLFTLNAMDHVNNFSEMCEELFRVLKPGGIFIAGFNLEEPVSICEPQQLNEKKIKKHILDKLEVLSYRITNKGPAENGYAPFFEGNLTYTPGQEGFLWVKARKNIH